MDWHKIVGIRTRPRRADPRTGHPVDDGIGIYFVKKTFIGFVYNSDDIVQLKVGRVFDWVTLELVIFYRDISRDKFHDFHHQCHIGAAECLIEPELVILPASLEEIQKL